MITDHASLHVFGLAHRLVIDVHRATESLAQHGHPVLQSQLRSAAQGAATSIAEGNASREGRNYEESLHASLSSARQLESLLDLSDRLGCLTAEAQRPLRRRCRQLTCSLTRLAASSSTGTLFPARRVVTTRSLSSRLAELRATFLFAFPAGRASRA